MEVVRQVTLLGGPMDGRRIDVPPASNEVEVTMEDLSRHRYQAESPASSVFVYAGRL